ncbi:MAG: hypothetical protein KH828_00960 [Clostridiales bacterium]|nr:hypothetical protein [Clostridiales bacterium]
MNSSYRCMSLDGQWKLYFMPEPQALSVPEGKPENSQAKVIGASIPGNVELDLQRAGLEGDPFYGTNVYNYRKYEFYSWWFIRTFTLPEQMKGENIILHLDGADTFGTIYINDQKVGECANMLIPHEFDITRYVMFGEENKICVYISSAMNWARKEYYPVGIRVSEHTGDEFVKIRKAPHSFGWDISGRFLSAGLWKSVWIYSRPETYIKEVYYAVTDLNKYRAQIECLFRFETDVPVIEEFTAGVIGKCGGSSFEKEVKISFVAGKIHLEIENPALWWPKGYGAPNLYEFTFRLMYKGLVVDSRSERFGIRKIDIETSYEEKDAGEFLIKVNNIPIMVKGTNWVFLDCLHSRDILRLQQAHDLLDDLGCNMVRCWGGNVYESDRFYELCDERGIMVWQDFSMACGIYSQYDDFARIMEEEAQSVIIRLRNHPCIALWAGDNEIDQLYMNVKQRLPHARYNRLSREILPRALAMHDPYREYVPSSPYIPEGYTDEYKVPEQHNWGARDYFKGNFYRNSTAHFVSETGYHGCPAVSSLKRYIPEEELWPFSLESKSWATHNSEYLKGERREYDRNQLMINQVKVLFGCVPENMEDFVLASQISQAEAKKFFVETARLKKWRRTGILWWNLLDGWPQISDAVVDYYFSKKLGYYYLKRIQHPLCILIDESEEWKHRVVLANDSRVSCMVDYCIRDGETGEVLAEGREYSHANENLELKPLPSVPGEQRLYVMEWKCSGEDKIYANHYISGYIPLQFEKYKQWLKIIEALPEKFSVSECIK